LERASLFAEDFLYIYVKSYKHGVTVTFVDGKYALGLPYAGRGKQLKRAPIPRNRCCALQDFH